jgi:predicted dehydrogenase
MLASRNPQSAALVPGDCVVKADWREILDARAIDGVIIATPPALHAEMARAAIEWGIPVLVEKPLTLSLEEATALRNLAAARGVFVMVDHTHLFNPAWRALKEAATRHGALHAISGLAGNMGPFRTDPSVLWDWGAHDVALALDIAGALPGHVEARRLETRVTPEGAGEVVEIRATFPGAISAVLAFGNILPRARRLAVYLEGAVLVYDDVSEHKLIRYPASAPHAAPQSAGEPLPFDARLPLTCVVSEFAAALEAGSTSLRSLDLGVDVVRVLERCEASLANA